ncbi:MAG: electron transfer flavoprotein subunit beta/FixA family protein [Chloroflexi bacterium]|nr:electron transfer flavoprotein subunit beta/FixA family protein [Chloroflexota bacterium]
MRIVVCAKQVADWEATSDLFGIGSDGKVAVDPRVKQLINLFDEHAIEAGLQTKEAGGGTVNVLSLGSATSAEVGKRALRMGCDEAAVISDPALAEADAVQTAWALAAGVQKLGGADLVLCGRQSADTDASQVGAQLAAQLGMPFIGAVRRIDASEGSVTVERVTGNGRQTLRVALPAVVSVTNEINKPRLTSVQGIMAAMKKKVPVWSLADLGAGDPPPARVSQVRLFVPQASVECKLIAGEDAEQTGELLALALREARVI